MSTIHVDDALYHRTEKAAHSQGKSVDEFVESALREALVRVAPPTVIRNGLLVFDVAGLAPPIEPESIRRCIEEEGF